MTTDLFHQLIIGLAAVFLCAIVWQIFNRRSGGISLNAMRDAVGFSIVVAFLLEDAFQTAGASHDVTSAFWVILGGWLFAKVSDEKITPPQGAATATPPITVQSTVAAPLPSSVYPPGAGTAGFVNLRLLIAIALFIASVMFLSGCGTIVGTVQKADDALAAKYGQTENLMKARAEVVRAEADRAGLTVIPSGASVIPVLWDPVSKSVLTNYAQAATAYVIVTAEYNKPAAPTTTFNPFAISAPEKSNSQLPSSAATSLPGAENSLPISTKPAPTPGTFEPVSVSSASAGQVEIPLPPRTTPDSLPTEVAVANAGGNSSVIETRTYRVSAAVKSATGALAPLVQSATADVEVDVTGAAGFTADGGAVALKGKILSLSNCPPLNTGALVFSNYAGTVSNGTLFVTSRRGGDVQFEGSANLGDGTISATLLPTLGSPASAFFQRLEVTGSAMLTGVSVTTNASLVVPPSGGTIPAEAGTTNSAICDDVNRASMELFNGLKIPAKPDLHIVSARLNGHSGFSWESEPRTWDQGHGVLVGDHVCFGWISADGKAHGGIIDWSHLNFITGGSRDFHNLFPGAAGGGCFNGALPAAGDKCIMWTLSNDGGHSSDIRIMDGAW